MKRPEVPPALPIAFVIIGIILAVIGLITNDNLWYIRTVIFLLAAAIVWKFFTKK